MIELVRKQWNRVLHRFHAAFVRKITSIKIVFATDCESSHRVHYLAFDCFMWNLMG